MLNNIKDIMCVIDTYYDYLQKKNFLFDSKGFPIFDTSMFLKETPQLIVPFNKRKNKLVTNPKKTLICHFCNDEENYRRVENVFRDIGEYKKYMGSTISDVSITEDMDSEYQDYISLLNQLFGAVLVTNSIKIVMSTRTGLFNSNNNFLSTPKGIMYISSFLGCQKQDKPYNLSYINKIVNCNPSKLLIYGKEDKYVNQLLDYTNIPYKYYVDFHRLCKSLEKQNHIRRINYVRL